MTHSSATIIPFPAHRARPSLWRQAQTLADTAHGDQAAALWDPLPVQDGNRIECADLCAGLPQIQANPDPDLLATTVAEFAILGLFAIQTGQWMRPDLLGDLMALQAHAEKMRLSRQAVAQRA